MEKKHLSWAEVHLDALRGLAALAVALGHARELFFSAIVSGVTQSGAAQQTSDMFMTGILSIGHEAVMVFFVLSGYLVGGSVLKAMRKDSWAWKDYLIKRLVRLWIVLIPAVFIGVLIDNLGRHFFSAAGSIYLAPAGQEFVKPEYFDQGHRASTILGNIFFLQRFVVPVPGTNVVLWSLAYEFWYYMLFPAILLALRPNTGALIRIGYGGAAIGIAMFMGAHADYLFLTWVLGASISLFPLRIPPNRAGRVIAIAAVVFLVAFIEAKKLNVPLYVGEMLIALLSGVLIYTIRCQSSNCDQLIYSGTSRFFSNISYTLYLTHLPFLILICALINSPWTHWHLTSLNVAKFAAIFALVIPWSYGIYRLFEANTDTARAVIMEFLSRRGSSGHVVG